MMLAKTVLSPASLLALASQASAFWRLPCEQPIVVQRADPLISPGAVSGHVHTVMGGNGFGFEMDYAATQNSTCTSCRVIQDKSNYWVPSLYYKAQNGSFISVNQVGGALVYYLQRNDPHDVNYPYIKAFPEGFRMIAGNPFLRNFSGSLEQKAVGFACLSNGNNHAITKNFPNYQCPQGLKTQVTFPSCWNGVDLDSPDHKSHVAYPDQVATGVCPPGFPVRLIQIFYEVTWNAAAFDNDWYGNSQPFVLSNGDPTGYGFHGDFINGWHVPTLQNAVNTCTAASGNVQDCPLFNLSTPAVAGECVVPSSISEPVFGVLGALPGCNPIQSGPQLATQHTNCGAPTKISQPNFPYTDLTASKKFAYVGCGLDIAGQSRTLPGARNYSNEMTVESCVDFCTNNDYIVAGLEDSTQCFCGNGIPPDRAPVPNRLRDCSFTCGGNPNQICGGWGLISLYQKCSSSKCQNAPLVFINGSVSATSNSAAGPAPISSAKAAKSTKNAAGQKSPRLWQY